ncbi:AAA family ATPase [Streptomyces mangrovisoli]|uniref:HTH luxR-type domain-containing protein n=1 Tax=Streptomyces mangrovisoli TaxID=1428628 RepID=A0A1J4P0G2_9ACTN|nr:LuxR family transcriptional regulator [Streptomyces mangrovisoli]OIJ68217.1 hypothetical protein WN71_009265 [Streptomyces mangrovisoli]
MAETGRMSVAGVRDTLLATCAVGRSRTVLIEGPAGCGKTHLLDTVAQRARDAGALVLTAAATPAGRRTPLGMLRQLLDQAPAFALPATAAAGTVPAGRAARIFCAELTALAQHGPVVVCVDDAQHADARSLAVLRHVVGHAHPAPVLVVATVAAHAGTPVFADELLRRTHVRRIRLAPLSRQESGAALADRPAADQARLHHLSGGNPRLLRALEEELRENERRPGAAAVDGAVPAQAPAPAPGGRYAAAVLACLRSSGPAAVAVGRALAVLDEHAAEPLLARLLADSPETAAAGLVALRSCGLLTGLRFAHPAVRTTVLADAPAAECARLHRRAARALHTAGAPAAVVAAHLLTPHAVGVRRPARARDAGLLRATAEELLAAHRPQQAEALLELAHSVDPDRAGRAEAALRLAQIAARRDPDTALHRLRALTGTHRTDTPVTPAAPGTSATADVGGDSGWGGRLAALLLVQGRIEEAARWATAGGHGWDGVLDADPQASVELLWSAPLTDDTFAPLALALRTLICAARPREAAEAAGRLAGQAAARKAPGWRAVFTALHAEALLRGGDATAAKKRAAAALAASAGNALGTPGPLTGPGGTGGPGGPGSFARGSGGSGGVRTAAVAVLVEACTVLGEHQEAARHAASVPLRTRSAGAYTAHHLRARGLAHLAGGRPQAALADFRRVGRLLAAWQADRPVWLPWRTDAAEALLRLGRTAAARELAEAQLTGPDGHRPQVREACLRLLAAAGPDGGPSTGEGPGTAFATGAPYGPGARRRTSPAAPTAVPGTPGTADGGLPLHLLDGPDRQIAELAAEGLTNRQIATRLNLALSTVERRLTRVYRTLHVPGRTGLPAGPRTDARWSRVARTRREPPASGSTPGRPPAGSRADAR